MSIVSKSLEVTSVAGAADATERTAAMASMVEVKVFILSLLVARVTRN
jgi:hypothetical protein